MHPHPPVRPSLTLFAKRVLANDNYQNFDSMLPTAKTMYHHCAMMEPNQAIQYRSRFDCTSHLPSIRVIDFNHIPGSGASIASSKVAPTEDGYYGWHTLPARSTATGCAVACFNDSSALGGMQPIAILSPLNSVHTGITLMAKVLRCSKTRCQTVLGRGDTSGTAVGEWHYFPEACSFTVDDSWWY